MPSTLLVEFTVCVLVAGLVVFEGSVVQQRGANAVHALLVQVADPRSICTGHRVEELHLALFVFTGIAGAVEVEVFFSFRIEATDSLFDAFLAAQLPKVGITVLLFELESQRRTHKLLGLVLPLETFAVDTSESNSTLDRHALFIIFDASAVEAVCSFFAFDFHALSDIRW